MKINYLHFTNNKESKDTTIHSSEFNKEISLHSVNGSKGIQFVLTAEKDNSPLRQTQFTTYRNEKVNITINEGAELLFKSSNINRIELPNDSLYYPENQAFYPIDTKQLDILFIVDATMNNSALINLETDSNSTFLLENEVFVKELTKKINDFITALSDTYDNIAYSILSYGDVSTTGVKAYDLRPSFILSPKTKSSRYFLAWEKHNLEKDISHLKPSSGCDYVDALAEALHETLDYNWRNTARKLIFVIGDSPGFSIEKPAPVIGGVQANTAIRHYNLESESMRLHKNKIEIMSLYINDDTELERSSNPIDKLRHYTKTQYIELATLDSYSQTWEEWQTNELATIFKESANKLLGRGFCYPILLESGA